MWVNTADPAKSDAVLFFSNSNPAIPAGPNGSCAVQAANNGGQINLVQSACGVLDAGADMTQPVTDALASMWNITGKYSTS